MSQAASTTSFSPEITPPIEHTVSIPALTTAPVTPPALAAALTAPAEGILPSALSAIRFVVVLEIPESCTTCFVFPAALAAVSVVP